jgi:hypothetical protein
MSSLLQKNSSFRENEPILVSFFYFSPPPAPLYLADLLRLRQAVILTQTISTRKRHAVTLKGEFHIKNI